MKRLMIGTIVLIVGFTFAVPAGTTLSKKANSASTSEESRIKLAFVVDQGFANGVLTQRDTVGMKHIIDTLKPLQEYYDVYAIFAPHVANKDNLEAILDLCAKNDMPFMFDVMSSSAMALGGCPQTAPVDEAHCVEISLEDLAKYKKRYGRYLAGMRFMEVFGQDVTVIGMPKYHSEWLHDGYSKMPDPNVNVFEPSVVRPFFEFAQKHKMFVQWSEFHWCKKMVWDYRYYERNKQFLCLLEEFPGLVTVTYANNEPPRQSIPRLNEWHNDVEPLLTSGAKDYGLSNQAWLYNDAPMECPIEELIAWTRRALELGCRYIEYEPVFYFFEVPFGKIRTQDDYTKDPKWKNRGAPRAEFEKLAQELSKMAKEHEKAAANQKLRPIHVEKGERI
jgi:hypothetical protein